MRLRAWLATCPVLLGPAFAQIDPLPANRAVRSFDLMTSARDPATPPARSRISHASVPFLGKRGESTESGNRVAQGCTRTTPHARRAGRVPLPPHQRNDRQPVPVRAWRSWLSRTAPSRSPVNCWTPSRSSTPPSRPPRHLGSVAPRLSPQAAKKLAGCEGVAEVYSVSGEWDLVVIVRVAEYEQIARVVTEVFPTIPGLLKTTTLTAFRAYSKKDLQQAWDIGVE